MSQNTFQDRLARVQSQTPTADNKKSHRAWARQKQGPSFLRLGLGLAFIFIGSQLVKYANQNYEILKEAQRPMEILSTGLGGMALTVVGAIVGISAFKGSAHTNAARRDDDVMHQNAASLKATRISGLVGLLFGAIACFCVVLLPELSTIGTDKARGLMALSALVALILFVLSVLMGCIGIFLRGYALGRVPLCFVCGAIITFALRIVVQPDFGPLFVAMRLMP